MSLGAFLKSERKCKNLTQEEVAAAVGVVSPVVSKWENDKSVPDLAALCVVCRLLDLSVEEVAAERRFADDERILPPRSFDPEALGETLRTLRIKNGLSQSEVGQKLYVTSQTVSKWESGAVAALETLLNLAEFYGVAPSRLLNGISDPEKSAPCPFVPAPIEAPRRKRTLVIITAILVAAILALSVVGVCVGVYECGTKQSGQDLPSAPETPDTPQTPSQSHCTLTIHLPDGNIQVHTLRIGVAERIVPEYRSADVKYLTYNDRPDGTGTRYPATEDDYRLFADLELYPVYRSKWVDFTAASSTAEREAYAAVETAASESEELLSGWLGQWASMVFAREQMHRAIYDGTEPYMTDTIIGASQSALSVYAIYESKIPDSIAEVISLTEEREAFADLRTRLSGAIDLQKELNREFQDFEVFDPDYESKDEEEREAYHIGAAQTLLTEFMDKIYTLTALIYGYDDTERLWSTEPLRGVYDTVTEYLPNDILEKYGIPPKN